jgi:uncharacterized membrane protein
MYKRLIFSILLLFFSFFILTPVSVSKAADELTTIENVEVFYKAQVLGVLEEGSVTAFGYTNPYQKLRIKFLDGDLLGQEIIVDHGKGYTLDKNQLVKPDDFIVVIKNTGLDGEPTFQIIDKYRLHQIIPIIVFFFLSIILLSKWQGVGSILGMIVSLGVIIKYIIPQILAGQDPLFVSIVGCLIIMVSTIYLAHGFNKKTTIALLSTFLTLLATGLFSLLFVHAASLSGLGTEDAYSLKLGSTASINLKGLLLGGILIGTLGVLDDVTTGLSASVFELAKVNPKLKFSELFKSGLSIGREHIASLVNTLVLAYAGASLPIFLTLILNPNHYPTWLILNDELIMEEVVRTLAGSLGLVLAVPLTTFLAAFYLSKLKPHGQIKNKAN